MPCLAGVPVPSQRWYMKDWKGLRKRSCAVLGCLDGWGIVGFGICLDSVCLVFVVFVVFGVSF